MYQEVHYFLLIYFLVIYFILLLVNSGYTADTYND